MNTCSIESVIFGELTTLALAAMPSMSMSRRSQQKLTRKKHVGLIFKKLSSRLNAPKHVKRMATTSRILPMGNLRRRCVKDLFTGWALDLVGQGRVLTKKLSKQVCTKLRKHFNLGPSHDDGGESKMLHRLLKLARKRKLGTHPLPKMSSSDVTETLPYDPEDWRYDCLDFMF